MGRRLISVLLALTILGGCALTSKQQELLERGAEPPNSGASLIGRSVGENGVVCRYSDGTVVRRLNVATPCF